MDPAASCESVRNQWIELSQNSRYAYDKAWIQDQEHNNEM